LCHTGQRGESEVHLSRSPRTGGLPVILAREQKPVRYQGLGIYWVGPALHRRPVSKLKKKKLLAVAALLLLLTLLPLVYVGRTHRPRPSTQQTPKTLLAGPTALEVARSNAAPLILNFWATNAVLARLSSNNAAFQEWGRAFILRVANDHLSKVPLFGL